MEQGDGEGGKEMRREEREMKRGGGTKKKRCAGCFGSVLVRVRTGRTGKVRNAAC